jgi:F-type H+-transporting ATPase subunit b
MIELKPDLSLLAIIAIFILNYLIVRKFLVEPVNGVLEWREGKVRDADQRYEEALTGFNAGTEEIEKRLMEAKREGVEIRERYRREAGLRKDELIQKTREQADAMIREATESLDQEVARARDTIGEESEQLARLAAEQILGRRLA